MKYKNLMGDIFIGISSLSLFKFLRADLVLTVYYFLLFPYLILTNRKKLISHLLIATGIAFIWTLISKDMYNYNHNMFTFIGWTCGLFGVYLLFTHINQLIPKQKLIKKLLVFIVFYWALLLIGETLAYHILNIKDLATASFTGLPICDCIHAPRWMQIAYFLMGPLYFGICLIFGLETPPKKK